MKTSTSIHFNSVHRLLSVFSVIGAMAFAACSDITGTAGAHPTVNLQSATLVASQTGDNVTVGPQTYNSETHGFENSWPFGPESNPQ
jgi:hypothetical protein